MDFESAVVEILFKVTDLSKAQIAEILEVPSNPELGDIAFPCFKLAKSLKKNPQIIAKELKEKINLPENSINTEINVVGSYLNFFFDETQLAKQILERIWKEKDKFGYISKEEAPVVVVEFVSPNTNKPLHLGHLRNMALGESVSRILTSQGYKVVRVSLFNNRGIHICKSMLAYKRWGNGKEPDKKSDHFVGDYYVLYSQKLKELPELENEADEMLKKWEQKDPETRALWQKMNEWAIAGFNQTYDRFGTSFDKLYYESDIWESGKEIILQGLKDKIFYKDETGATKVDLGKELGTKVLIRANGTSLYIVQDLFLAKLNYDTFKFNKYIYVVANEQDYHFKALFKILDMLGFRFVDSCYHLNYGLIFLPEGKMKSREGTVVDADDLMDELVALAKEEIKLRGKSSQFELDILAEKIALGAVKYFFLKFSAHKGFTFNPEESVSFDGETGVFLLYSLVRAKQILKKAQIEPTIAIDFQVFQNEEVTLIKNLGNFPNVISKTANMYTPHILAKYAFDLASLFNIFYEKYPVIKAENKELQKARLLLVDAFIHVIRSCLYLLGIEEVEAM